MLNPLKTALDIMSRGVMADVIISDWSGKTPKTLLIPSTLVKERNRLKIALRSILIRYSFKTKLGFFLPRAAIKIWSKETEDCWSEMLNLRDGLVRHRNAVVGFAADAAKDVALKDWASIYPDDGGPPPGSFIKMVERVTTANVPTTDVLFERFGLEPVFFPHPLLILNTRWGRRVPARSLFTMDADRQERIAWDFIEKVVVAHAKSSDAKLEKILAMIKKHGAIRGFFLDSVEKSLQKMVYTFAAENDSFVSRITSVIRELDTDLPSKINWSTISTLLLETREVLVPFKRTRVFASQRGVD